MRTQGTRRSVALACTVTMLGSLLAACGSDDGNNGGLDTTPVTATTSTAAPQSTTTLATVATTPAATEPVVSAAPALTTKPTAAPTTAPATTVADTTATTATADTTAPVAADYAVVEPPKVPSTSAAVMADNSHPDGVYYATVTEGGDPPPADGAVVFELVQLFIGDACTAHFGTDDPDLCLNDYGVETDPTGTIEVPLDRQYVTVADATTQQSYRITGPELYGLIHGDDPSAGAPEGYLYSGFGYFLTVSGGKVTRLEQWWTP